MNYEKLLEEKSDNEVFKIILKNSGMSMNAFSQYFNIPYRTVQDWNADKRVIKRYILKLIIYKLSVDKLI